MLPDRSSESPASGAFNDRVAHLATAIEERPPLVIDAAPETRTLGQLYIVIAALGALAVAVISIIMATHTPPPEPLIPAEMTAQLESDPCNARLVQILNAIAAYTAAHGDPPAALSALQPDYVSFEPIDPVTNQPYRYQTLGQSVSLACPPAAPAPAPVVAGADDSPGI
jgi:hypothetical protein